MNLVLRQTVRVDAMPVSTIAGVLSAALDAHREDTLDELLRQRPGAIRWLVRQFLQSLLGSAGDALPVERRVAAATELLLAWAITQLRPDRQPSLAILEREHWLDRTSWRPAIAVMCQYGFAPVPEFRDRYYRRPGESPADNLCGLWNIGQSTFYRYLDKGKRLMARLLHEQRLDGRHIVSLRAYAQQHAYHVHNLTSPEQQAAWHLRQSGWAAQADDHLSAAWHLSEARAFSDWRTYVIHHVTAFAGQSEFETYLRHFTDRAILPRGNLDLEIVEAALARVGDSPDREREAYERALRYAADAKNMRDTGVVYGHLGKFYEQRDPDRALAYYRDSADLLEAAIKLSAAPDPALADAYSEVLIKLAWLYVLRNDPRAQAVLESAQTIRAQIRLDDATAAPLEQAWGEYWRRAKKFDQSLAHRLRALAIYERLGDREGVIKALLNIGLVYVDQNRLDKAEETYRHVLGLIETSSVSQELAASAHANLGISYYLQGEFDLAIKQYEDALAHSNIHGFVLISARAHEGLAEAYFGKFLTTHDPAHESSGDAHVEASISAYLAADSLGYADTVRKLKSEILRGAPREQTNDRLLPQETAAHYAEISDIEHQRATLAAPAPPQEHIRAHLAIANAYLAISAKEREQALALIDKHGLQDQFAGEFAQLRATYERELTREQKLAAQWKAKAGDLLGDEKRAAVLKHLVEHGSVNKSGYADLCGVGLATASKHLGQLAEMGLLTQVGKGPSTRYVLPQP